MKGTKHWDNFAGHCSRYIVFEIFWGWGNEDVVVDLGIIKVKFHYVRKKRETKPKM